MSNRIGKTLTFVNTVTMNSKVFMLLFTRTAAGECIVGCINEPQLRFTIRRDQNSWHIVEQIDHREQFESHLQHILNEKVQ